ncbi:MAG TPA: choline/ethanolamine kinase family protein [Devosia sp.]|nr:choline/ethanolamine kinase family protein [Devosia sp.]
MSSDLEDARAALAAIPGFATRAASAEIARLGGLTNRVFRIGLADQSLCLRLPGAGTEAYINRTNEAQAARAAAAAGVSPEVLHAAPGSGIMLTRFIEGATTMSPAFFKSRPGSPARAGAVFRKLHESGARFDSRFELFAMVDDYLKFLAGKPVALPDGYHATLSEAETIRAALAAHPLPIVACHCDPLSENFLDTGTRMWIVDWEYSGMNDPMWDLGDLSVEAEFGPAQDAELVAGYFGRPPTPSELGRMVIYKAMCDLLWTLWGLIQLANANPADDFKAYAERRFARCRALMATPEFAAHIRAVAAGA